MNINAAPMPGLNGGHAGGNPKFQAPISRAWSADIGGGGTALTDLAPPVVGDGRVHTVAPNGTVSAFDVKNGAAIWSVEIEAITDDPLPGIGGGIALSPEGLLVHAGGNVLVLLNPASGEMLWSLEFDLPLRGGPTIVGSDRAVVTDLDGNMKALLLVSGEMIWTHLGIAANTVVFGAPAPAVADGEIVLAGAGGEVSYFDAANGELLWTDSVASLLPRTPIQNIGDVRANRFMTVALSLSSASPVALSLSARATAFLSGSAPLPVLKCHGWPARPCLCCRLTGGYMRSAAMTG